MGYAIAWGQRRALLSVLVPVLVPAQLVLLVLRLLSGSDSAVVVNGELITAVPHGFMGFVHALIAGAAWLLAVSAGVVVVGLPSLGTKEKLKRAAKALPALAFWTVAGAVAIFAALTVAENLGWLGIVLLAVLVVLLARGSLVLPATVLDGGPWWELAGGRLFRVAGRILLGTLAVPLLLAWCVTTVSQKLLEWLPSGATAAVVHLLGTLLLFAVVAGQAGTLATVYLDLRDEQLPEVVAAPRIWAVALVLPTIAAAALTPAHGPQIMVRHNAVQNGIVDIVWNSGQYPVVFTGTTAYRCQDNACRSGEESVFFVYPPETTAVGVGPRGTLLSVTMSRDDDTDTLEIASCAGECADFGRLALPKREESHALPEYGISAAPDGSVWIAVAQQRTKASKVDYFLIRCDALQCGDDSYRVAAGTIDGRLSNQWPGRTVHLRFPADGPPTAEFDTGYGTTHVITCDTAACGKASLSQREDNLAVPQPPIGRAEAVAANELGHFYVSTEQAADPTPFRITIGEPKPRFERIVLWHCADPSCRQPRRIPLHTRQAAQGREVRPSIRLAVGPDGTVLVAEGRTITSLHL